MKTLITFVLAFVLVSCTKTAVKDSVQTNADNSITYTFGPVYSGSQAGVSNVLFNVSVKDNAVSKIDLYKSPSDFRDEVTSVTTSSYKLYDRVGSYPTYNQSVYYYFVITYSNGSTLNTKPVQVY